MQRHNRINEITVTHFWELIIHVFTYFWNSNLGNKSPYKVIESYSFIHSSHTLDLSTARLHMRPVSM